MEFWEQALSWPAEERIQRYAAAYNTGITGQWMNDRNVSRAQTEQFIKDRQTPIILDALIRAADIKYGPAKNPYRMALGGRESYTPGAYGLSPTSEQSLDEQIRDARNVLDELEARR